MKRFVPKLPSRSTPIAARLSEVIALGRLFQSDSPVRSCRQRLCSILAAAIFVCFLNPVCHSFDLPDRDPWYYQSDEAGYTFMIPDKAQHYWGSALLNEVGKHLPLPSQNVTSPALVLTAGFFYEVWQESKGIGFSPRDLMADVLGVASSQFSNRTFSMWLEYSPSEKTIMINLTRPL